MIKESLLEISRNDLEASKILFEKGLYSNALFNFHQSVEKAAKYLAFAYGFSESEFKQKIGHDGIKLFKELLKKVQQENNLVLIESLNPHDFTNLTNELNNLSDRGVVEILSKQINNIIDEPYPIPIDDMSKPFQLLIDYMIGLGITHEVITKPMDEWVYKGVEKMLMVETLNTIINVNLSNKVIPLLFLLTIFTNYYKVDDFRYPNIKTDNPIEYFNIENPYVTVLLTFIEILKSNLKDLEELVKMKK